MAKKKGTEGNGQLSLFGAANTITALNNQLSDIERKITALYGSTYKFAAQLAQVRTAVSSGQEFTFADNPAAAKAIENRLQAVANTLDQQLGKATERSFALGQASTEHALTKALGTDKATKKEVESICANAAAEMRRRGADGHTYYTQSRGGVTTSDRVWNITESTKLELEIAIQQAALEGKSADDLAQTIQQYLQHPERLFRSVRVKDPVTGQWTGEYRMSKAAQQCHPGQGVYRSAYKNALRLARTELTQAYRRAEWETYQDNPLITGYRIELSNNHTTTVRTKKGVEIKPLRDICDEMAGTQYPKTFLWTGWHPQCRCRMIPVTISKDDFKERVKARHRGKLDEWQPKEQTTEMPKAFTDWVEANKHRWQQPGHAAPFFIRDNYQQGNVAKGLDTRITAELEQARLAAEATKAKEPTIPEPITDYDAEVMELRSAAAKFGLDIQKMEQIREEGQDKKALRKEIDKQKKKLNKKIENWNQLYKSATEKLERLYDLIVDNDLLMEKQNDLATFDQYIEEARPEKANDERWGVVRLNYTIDRIGKYEEKIRRELQTNGEFKGNDPDLIKQEYKVTDGELAKVLGYSAKDFDLIGFKRRTEKLLREKGINVWQYAIDESDEPDDKDGWNLRISGSGITLDRRFFDNGNGLECHHSLFTLRNDLQGKGISKDLFRELYTEYKRMGIRYITVDANIDVGGYTWAKYGFYAAERFDAEYAVVRGRYKDKALEIIDDFYKTHTNNEPFPMNLIANQPWGRETLLGSFWTGIIDLQDEKQRKIWETYLGL